MSLQLARKPFLYDHLVALPEELTGESNNGQLRIQLRPDWPHVLASSQLVTDIEDTY